MLIFSCFRLVDIVKRLPPELKKLGFDVQRGVLVGLLSQKTGAEDSVAETADAA